MIERYEAERQLVISSEAPTLREARADAFDAETAAQADGWQFHKSRIYARGETKIVEIWMGREDAQCMSA